MVVRTHILILEDDDQLASGYGEALRQADFHILRMSRVADAIHNLMRFDPDVLCLDWQLEDETSEMLLYYLRRFTPEQLSQVVLLSDGMDLAPIQQQYAGMVQTILTKPIPAPLLIETMQQAAVAAIHRQPFQRIAYEVLEMGKLLMIWEGNITAQAVRRHMHPALAQAEEVILDIRNLALERLAMGQFGLHHRALPNLQRIHIIHAAESAAMVPSITAFLPPHIQYTFSTER